MGLDPGSTMLVDQPTQAVVGAADLKDCDRSLSVSVMCYFSRTNRQNIN